MNKLVLGLAMAASIGAQATTQVSSSYTDINFSFDEYVSIDIPEKVVYMTLEEGMSDKIIRQSINVPVYLDWMTNNGVKFSATCTSPAGKPNLCKDHGLVEFPLLGVDHMYTDIYVKGSTKEYHIYSDTYRVHRGEHHIKVGVDAIPNFIKDYGKKYKENTFLYTITIEARV